MRPKFNPKAFGLGTLHKDKGEAVPPLPPKPERVKVLTDEADKAWRIHDALRVLNDGDRTLADVMFDRVRRQKEHTHGTKKRSEEARPRRHRDPGNPDD